MTELERVNEDIRLVNEIDFLSVDKDNMEYEARVSAYQVDALRRLVGILAYCYTTAMKAGEKRVQEQQEQGDLFDRLASQSPRSEDSGDHPVELS